MSTETVDNEVDFFDLSDDEIMKLDPSNLPTASAESQDDKQVEDTSTVVVDATKDDDEDKSEDTNGDDKVDSQGNEDSGTTTEGSDADKAAPDSKAKQETVKAEQGKTEVKPEDTTAPDYKKLYEQIVAPFKANGREIKVQSPEDAVALMQMGANYNKKMAALKPNLKLMKMLEANGLLDEDKLSYLIDLDRKDPAAINKLVNDSKIDPLDLSADKAGEYKPGTYTVDERELELDGVLDDLRDSPAFARTLEVVSNKWDGASKRIIAQNPDVMKTIASHVEAGIYDIIAAEIENERTFGRLKGLSDIEAYKQVGDAIDARGGFAHLNTQKPVTSPAQAVKPALNQAEEDKRRDKKRAASPTKAVATSSALAEDFNPLNLSDEEFMKIKPKYT